MGGGGSFQFVFAARIGEIAALGTAICWTITALSFEAAGKRIGALTVNLIRLVFAVILFVAYGLVVRGALIPTGISASSVGWLALSGLVGFVIGDFLLFQAFVEIGARVSMLIYSSVPPLTAVLAWLVLGERLGTVGLAGMALTVAGIAIVVLKRPVTHKQPAPRLRGILLAFGGALGQAGGLVLGRLGAGTTLDPFAATEIRAVAGLVGFAAVFTIARRWRSAARAITNRPAMVRVGYGAVFGPFLGVSLGLFAAQHTSTGVASTIMALVPVLIIVPAIVIYRERVHIREITGSLIAVAGVALLFL